MLVTAGPEVTALLVDEGCGTFLCCTCLKKIVEFQRHAVVGNRGKSRPMSLPCRTQGRRRTSDGQIWVQCTGNNRPGGGGWVSKYTAVYKPSRRETIIYQYHTAPPVQKQPPILNSITYYDVWRLIIKYTWRNKVYTMTTDFLINTIYFMSFLYFDQS